MDRTFEWLPHLENSIPSEAYDFKCCKFLIALEGWRRGLTLKYYNAYTGGRQWNRFSLSYNDREHKFTNTRGDLVSKEAGIICKEKNLTKKVLMEAGVPVPSGKDFEEKDSYEDILAHADTMQFPLVVKPTDGSKGKGVVANIKDNKELKAALIYVREELGFSKVMVEEYFAGTDYRIYVVGDKVIGAVNRIPANVTGDGKSSIEQLIKTKNRQRKDIPYLYSCPIKIDREVKMSIKSAGYKLTSIPEKGEKIFLREKSNLSTGGDPIDVTDKLSPEINRIAVEAVKAVPGLAHCAVDLIVNEKTNTGVVIEFNSRAELSFHVFPIQGKGRDVPAAIVDYYFPETINNRGDNRPEFYFDLKKILEPLKNGAAQEVTVPLIPSKDNIDIKSFTVSGKVQGVGYRRWLQKKAINLKLNGFVQNSQNEDVLIVAAGDKEDIAGFRSLIHSKSPKKAEVKKVTEDKWEAPIKIGFDILIDDQPDKEVERLTRKIKRLEKQKKIIKKDKIEAERNYLEIVNSRTWKSTSPIRKTIDLVKKKK